MDAIAAESAVMFFVDLLGGGMAGVFACASVGSLREDNAGSLTRTAPSPLCGGVRVIHGVFTRGYQDTPDAQLDARTGRTFGNDEPGDRRDQDTHGQEPES